MIKGLTNSISECKLCFKELKDMGEISLGVCTTCRIYYQHLMREFQKK